MSAAQRFPIPKTTSIPGTQALWIPTQTPQAAETTNWQMAEMSRDQRQESHTLL